MNTYYYGYRAQKETYKEIGETMTLPIKKLQSFQLYKDSTKIAFLGRDDKDQFDTSLIIAERDTAKENKRYEKWKKHLNLKRILGKDLNYFGKTKAGVVAAAVSTASSCDITATMVPLFTSLAQCCGPAIIKSNQEFGYRLNMNCFLVGQPGSGKSWRNASPARPPPSSNSASRPSVVPKINSTAAPWSGARSPGTACAGCAAPRLRPDIVFFGEMPYEMDRIYDAIAEADLFVSIGTSGAVYPAAGFVQTAREAGARTIELNLEPSAGSALFDESRMGPATRLVPDLVRELLQ